MENFIVCAVCDDYFFKKYASVFIFASKCRFELVYFVFVFI